MIGAIAYFCVDGFIILLYIVRLACDDESYSVLVPLLVNNLLETDKFISGEHISVI